MEESVSVVESELGADDERSLTQTERGRENKFWISIGGMPHTCHMIKGSVLGGAHSGMDSLNWRERGKH